MKIEWIRTLQQVERLKSFTAVARQRGVTPMAISKQISQLEESLQEALIHRTRRGISMTEAGLTLLAQSQGLLNEENRLRTWLEDRHDEPSGTLKVLCLESEIIHMTLTPWMGEFMAAYPKISLEMILVPNFRDIDIDQADIFWGFSKYLGLIHPGLKQRKLLSTRYGIYASERYLARYGQPDDVTSLKHHWMIGNANNQPPNYLVVAAGEDLSDMGVDGVEVPCRIVTVTDTLELAEQGIGLVNIAESFFEGQIRPGSTTLKPVLEDWWVDELEAFAYYHQVAFDQPKVRAFLNFFCDRIVEWAQ